MRGKSGRGQKRGAAAGRPREDAEWKQSRHQRDRRAGRQGPGSPRPGPSVPLRLAGPSHPLEGAGWSGVSGRFAPFSRPAQSRHTDAGARVHRKDAGLTGGSATRAHALRLRVREAAQRFPFRSSSLLMPRFPAGDVESPPLLLTFVPGAAALETPGAARDLGGGAGVAHGSRAQRSRWGRSGGWRDGKEAEGGDSRLASPCQGPRAPGGGARVTRLWRGRLLRCCLPAGRESRGRCQGASPLQPGPWPAGLLGNQESQAQLIKLWAQAVQERSGVQDLQKPRGTAVPPRSPPSVQAPGGRTRPWGPLSPSWGSVASILSSPLPSHRSSASTRCSRPDPSTPSPTGGRAGMGVGDAR